MSEVTVILVVVLVFLVYKFWLHEYVKRFVALKLHNARRGVRELHIKQIKKIIKEHSISEDELYG